MDFEILKQVNGLWRKIYPYLASQIMERYDKVSGTVLELGPFSGGICVELAKMHPGLKTTIADESAHVSRFFDEKIRASGLFKNIEIIETNLEHLIFNDSQFDLVICRGALFFLDNKSGLLREIYRVLKQGGMAFIGGGYGKNTPSELIHEIADESRELNNRLGRKRLSVENLDEIIKLSELGESCKIVEEGGLWVIIEK